jgi:AraC-like DNA-binding protein/quercetin dioxygenase-like cupin family protein
MAEMQIAVTAGATAARVLQFPLGQASAMRFSPGTALPTHQHPEITIAVIVSGGFAGTYGNREEEALPASVVVEPAGEVHANRFGSRHTTILSLSITPGSAAALDSVGRDLRVFRDPFAGAVARRACVELDHSDDLTPLAVESAALELLTRVARSARDTGRRPAWLGEVRALVHDRYAEPLRISDVASAVGVEPEVLARAFRRAFGEPMARYMRRIRVEAAAQRLCEADGPIARIALDVGFADQSHLTRSFVTLLGTTPARYRAEQLGNRSVQEG